MSTSEGQSKLKSCTYFILRATDEVKLIVLKIARYVQQCCVRTLDTYAARIWSRNES